MDKISNFIKQFKIVDIIILVFVVIALFVGYATFKGYRQTASKQIEATSKIIFKVYMRGITCSDNEIPIKKDDKTFISIRNVPYSDLDILDVKSQRRQIVIPASGTKKFVIVVEDEAQPDLYDVVVTLTDNAKITKDGAVVGGNKIKIGLPITLEGKDYKFSGSVSEIKVVDAVDEEKINKDMNTTDDVQ